VIAGGRAVQWAAKPSTSRQLIHSDDDHSVLSDLTNVGITGSPKREIEPIASIGAFAVEIVSDALKIAT